MAPDQIIQTLETTILPRVSKPGRYLGNEYNVIVKEWSKKITGSIVLAFPDKYETAMPYNGFQMLYHIINRESDLLAERTYAPEVDMEAELRKHHVPLFSLETKHALADFDIIGFTLPYDLLYTNILNMLDLAGVPIWSKDRTDQHPFVIAGGTNAYNPEPIADFLDVVVIGDAEEIVAEVVRVIGKGRRAGKSREDIFHDLLQLGDGIYIPGFYDVTYGDDGRILSVMPNRAGVPERIKALKIPYLKQSYYPTKPIMPLIKTTQDRFAMEVMRGCTQGCRFCHAGMVYRPVRERKPEDLINQAKATLEATGYEEMALLSLSTSDYTGLQPTMEGMQNFLQERNVSVSFPSMRLDTFTNDIAKIARQYRKSGLTFAPEAGTWRMRRVINKLISDEDLRESVRIALNEGWKVLKFYFMLGLPTETEADLDGILDMIHNVRRMSQSYGHVKIHVTLSTFIPKPETPFQWELQDDKSVIKAKIDYLMRGLHHKQIKASYRNPAYSELEGIYSRGDRRLARLTYAAWKHGAKFDSWDDHLDYSVWRAAVEEAGISVDWYLREREPDEVLPWDHIDTMLLKKFLLRERKKAYREATVTDCRDGCHACGVCDFDELIMREEVKGTTVTTSSDDPAYQKALDEAEHAAGAVTRPASEANEGADLYTVRIRYSKHDEACFMGHLDVLKTMTRAIQKARLPVYFSEGFHKKPRISMGLALPLGYSSDSEYLDIQLYEVVPEILARLSDHLPRGLTLRESQWFAGRIPAISNLVEQLTHQVKFEDLSDFPALQNKVNDFFRQPSLLIQRKRKGKTVEIDLRPYVTSLKLSGTTLSITTQVINGMSVRMNEILSLLFDGADDGIPPHRVHREAVIFKREGLKISEPQLLTA
ncbi:MAG: TIGR03960 family B12-binding radical SAM protein [Candidatus Marinimicrobia bacterium]|nr:TIGR03960 family B12-binding radical SAM protein [Candidatus Neomarinimicrobiota bacterium]MCF7840655.1 TIGR03960 family B12-binding radical SAM protein [Candidatus Neomarinimicrobiota bacterium]